MDVTVEAILRDLQTHADNIAEQILGGRLVTIEMYQAQAQLRHAYLSMIDNIKERQADARHPNEDPDQDPTA